LLQLVIEYPSTKFSCLIDNVETASHLSSIFYERSLTLSVFIDLNVGMNRTGIIPENVPDLFEKCQFLPGINIHGLHAYDGHIRDEDLVIRKKRSDEVFAQVASLRDHIKSKYNRELIIVAGGTPTFSIHSKRKEIECSPGTYIYWDKGYQQTLKEQDYLFAALVITRVISKPADNIICVDLGHKSIASENTIEKRVDFINAPDLQPIGHSEEHMILKTEDNKTYQVGDVLYGIPFHICPTVALYDRVAVVEKNKVITYWNTTARNRKITI
jgi:D-threonine aldolase